MRYVCTTVCVWERDRWESVTQWEPSERIKLPCSSFPSLRKTWDWAGHAGQMPLITEETRTVPLCMDTFSFHLDFLQLGKTGCWILLRAVWRRAGQCFSGEDSCSTNLHVSLLGGGRCVWTTKVKSDAEHCSHGCHKVALAFTLSLTLLLFLRWNST